MTKKLLILLIGLCLTVQGIGQNFGYKFPEHKRKVTIPFELRNNHIILPLSVNGLKLKFILDTGVRYTILVDRVYADFLRIEYVRRVELLGADRNQKMGAFVAPGVNIQIKDIGNNSETLLVLEEDFLQFEKIFGADVQGIIGYELFKNFVVKIDYDNEVLTIYKPEKFKKPKPKRYKSYHMHFRFAKPYLETTITLENQDTVHGKLLIDTGASFDLLLDVNTSKKIRYPEKTISGDLGRGLGGLVEGLIGRVNHLDMMPYEFDGVITFFQEDSIFTDLSELTNRIGIIGGGILSRYKVIFDYPNQIMYLRKGKKYKEPFNFNMSGIVLEDGNNEAPFFVVKEIVPDSPAAKAGIMVGDKIVRLNGTYGKFLTRIYIQSEFKSKAGKRIKLRIIRNGVVMHKRFLLTEMI